MPKVSVLIPTYNCAKYIGQAIQSVLDQTFEDFEIIVSDNASTDNTEEVVKSFKDSRIRYYKSNINVEMGNNWNRCLFLSRGRYIAILCSDDIWLPPFLEKTVEILDFHPDVGLVFTNHYLFSNNIEWVRRRLVSPGLHYHFTNIVISKNPICISATLIRRACFDDVGEFKSYYTADYDMWLRISKTRWGIYYIDSPLLKYRMHESNLANDRYRMSDYAIRVLESHKFEEEIEKSKSRVIARLYIKRALASNILYSPKEALSDILRAIKICKREAFFSFLFLLVEGFIPTSLNLRFRFQKAYHFLITEGFKILLKLKQLKYRFFTH